MHYLGIVLSSGWSHFMLFNKQFKELILRRPKEPEAAATPEEATRIRDGAPGPNDEVSSCSFLLLIFNRFCVHARMCTSMRAFLHAKIHAEMHTLIICICQCV